MDFGSEIRKASPPAFGYPSKLNKSEIRLLKPTRISKTRLDFELVVTQRPTQCSAPRYTAISYTWGQEEPVDVIYLDKKPFPVRPNLWMCLYWICKSQERRGWHDLLWVDAICINQSDDAEKSIQVRAMSRTYSDATCVFAWLGLPRDVTEDSNHVTSLGQSTRPVMLAQLPAEEDISIPQQLYRRCTVWFNPKQDLQATLTVGGATWESEIGDLINRDYWTRRWVVQEFLLARNLYIFCGKASMHWHEFRILAHRYEMDLAADRNLQDEPASSAAIPILDGKAFRKKPWRSTLRHLLQQYSKMDCGDPRDRVFSLLSLASDVDYLQDVLPDYSISMDEVTIHIIVYRMRMIYERYSLNHEMDARLEISDTDWRTALFELGYDSVHKEHCDFLLDEAKRKLGCKKVQELKTTER